MCFAAPADLNMPPLSDRPVREPEFNSPAGRAKEHMKSFWKVLKESVETSALCVLQNLYANWQASFLEAVQETATKTARLAKNASQGRLTSKSGTLNSPRSTVPCSPGVADRLIDMINNHTEGVDRTIEGLLVRSGHMAVGVEAAQIGNETHVQAPVLHHHLSQPQLIHEQRGRSLVPTTPLQRYDRSPSGNSVDPHQRIPNEQQSPPVVLRGGQPNVLPYTIAHGQPIRSRSSAPGFLFEQTTISGQPRSHVYPPQAKGFSGVFPPSPKACLPQSPIITSTRHPPSSPTPGTANCRSVAAGEGLLVAGSSSVVLPTTSSNVPMPLVRTPGLMT